MKGVMQILLTLVLLYAGKAFSQDTSRPIKVPESTDSTTLKKNPIFDRDTVKNVVKGDTIKTVRKHDPKKATMRSLILPGWGQAYNKEYWKIPIVYGAIGTAAGIFVYNNMWYKRSRDAYAIRVDVDRNNSADTALIHPRLEAYRANDLQVLRNSFRRDRDYSALWFIVTWGLNIVDATVFGHLKEFDVSEDLSLKMNPVIKQNGNAGFSLVLGYKTPSRPRLLTH